MTSPRAFEEPAAHRRRETFLGDAFVQRLLSYAEARQADFRSTGIGRRSGTIDKSLRRSLMLWDLGDLRNELEERFRSVLPWATEELRLSPINLRRIELQLVAHGDGAFYREHIDTHGHDDDASTDRALTGVYYFHRQPKGFDGGALRLLAFSPNSDGVRRYTDIAPESDTLLLFPSWAPHEVRPVSSPSGNFMDSRFAINCWFRQSRKSD